MRIELPSLPAEVEPGLVLWDFWQLYNGMALALFFTSAGPVMLTVEVLRNDDDESMSFAAMCAVAAGRICNEEEESEEIDT